MSKVLGILGGMGPLATVNLYNKIIRLTEANCDQDHLKILIYNNSSIPDRTEYIFGRGENPLKYLIESAKKLEDLGADYLIMPCNTAHFFYEEIIKHIKIPFLNMIEETAKYICNKGETTSVGLLSTEGTINAKVYDTIFNKHDINIVKLSNENQQYITDIIYGIKSGNTNINTEKFNNIIEEFKIRGIDTSVLGCTELSTAYIMLNLEGNYIDPLEIIAVKAIQQAGKKVISKNLRTIRI